MLAYEYIRENVPDLTGNIYNTDYIHNGMNTRRTYYQKLIDFMMFMLANSPDFLVFCQNI